MQLAHIVPFKNRRIVQNQPMHLWVANAPGDWLHFYKELDKCHIILDNGAFEGEAVDFEKTLDIAAECKNVVEIVLPDVFRSAAGTLNSYYEKVVPHSRRAGLSGCSFMYVAHGPDVTAFEHCLRDVLRRPTVPISTIGLSYIPTVETYSKIFDHLPRSWVRSQAVRYMAQHGVILTHPTHCLGLWDPAELLSLAQVGRVRSCDTSLAACATHAKVEFQDKHIYPDQWSHLERFPRPENFFLFEGLDEGLLSHNIQFLNCIASQAKSYYE